ncbi:zinc-finger multi-pass transmembrane protein [Strigomonas culicis]|nr:zinc-finger multi-pass transmembrane protein [Strigomonas culicis]|eukprot:EPY37042.1 zinc-finger multi-pass transmembrane protein [Strigomonas culicis]
MFLARESISGREAALCNPIHFLWDVVDTLPLLKNLPMTCLVDCTWDEVIYQGSFTAFVFFFVKSVFSVPQVSEVEAKRLEKVGILISRCSKCGSCIDTMDHHCYLICNCVGRRNRHSFLLCLLSAVLNLSFLLWWCGRWAFNSHCTVTLLGLVLVIGFLSFMTVLLAFQLLLFRRGETTIAFLKRTAGLPTVRRALSLVKG